jgi:hypothetical protein
MPGSWFGRAWDPQSGHIRAAQGCTLSEWSGIRGGCWHCDGIGDGRLNE